ncbi:Y-family DNA polymerase [Paradesertivirga mongoliensis]|uniref:Y-family DNA polymerase n=1 Tax=Paradesertivirga mongoliensis TaxID=2100740 RepID=A0ABW4ZH03_9SPHI|nr:DNA polymerase Y family protein [Pedobacter mongoliensis]
MQKRYAAIWFRHLTTDWLTLHRPELKQLPFVLAATEHNRKVITAATSLAESQGIQVGMAVADAKAMIPDLLVFDEKPAREKRLLKALAEWCIRYTPFVALDLPDGLILDISGCTHLWGGEKTYLKDIVTRLRGSGYDVRAAIADTVGTAWAVSRFGQVSPVIESGAQASALLPLPAAALRLDSNILTRLQKLGLYQIGSFIGMPRSALRRRFGEDLLLRLAQALGQTEEYIQPIVVPEPWQERLPCMEPIRTAAGIEIAIKQLLETLCLRLQQEGKGIRTAILKCYRVDGKIQQVEIGTNKASHHVQHLFKLFELKISSIAPGLGIELFTLEALKVEGVSILQEALWGGNPGLDDEKVAELLDRITAKVGTGTIHRYLPDEHYWPERSIKPAASLQEPAITTWRSDRPRPLRLLATPAPVDVTAPIPDYPPLMFRYKGEVHHIRKADGPERIEREWWLEGGEHRDYYNVEDRNGQRYWLFRSGHYDTSEKKQWYLHGFFA